MGWVLLVTIVSLQLVCAQESAKPESGTDSTPQSDVERNKSVVRDFQEKIDKGDIVGALENFAENAENHGRKANKQIFRLILEDIGRTFPDTKTEILDIVAEGDSVVVRTKVSGTHMGRGKLPINGGLLAGVPPTGKHYEIQHIHWFKLRDGKIIAHWANRDDVGMMQQLGLLPTPERPASLSPPAAK
jgi:predicted ester cyclase